MNQKKWKILESEYLVNNKWISLKKEKCHLPNGTIIDDYYIAEKNDSIMIFAVTKDNKILMVSQYKHGAQEVVLELPAGYIDKDETPEQTATRELLEETGYKANALHNIGRIIYDPTNTRGTGYLFFTKDVVKVADPTPDKTEDITVIEVTKEELLKNIRNNTLCGGMAIAASFLGLEKLKEDTK